MNTVSVPETIRPRVARLICLLGSNQDSEALGAARELRRTLMDAGSSLSALAAVLDLPEPIIVAQASTSHRGAGGSMSAGIRLAGRLTRIAANPRIDLTTWDRDFIVSAVSTLRADLPLSKRQAAIAKRLLRIRGRRLR